MKKAVFLLVILCSTLILAACSSGQESSASASAGAGAKSTSSAASSEETALALQLALGTFRLEKTEYPVGAAQAAQLLPLWKAARSLSKSDTTAAEELSGLVKQMQSTLTSEQLQAIQAMGLTMQDLPAIAQELGIDLGTMGPPGNTGIPAGSTPSSGQSGQAPPGGGPGGGLPGDGGGPPPGGSGGSGGSSSQTTQAQSSDQSSFLGLNSTLLDAMIKFLKAKVQ